MIKDKVLLGQDGTKVKNKTCQNTIQQAHHFVRTKFRFMRILPGNKINL